MKTFDDRALNRARLHRQWLTERRDATPLETMEHLVGMQGQLGDPPYFQLWSRLNDFTTDDLSTLLEDRRAVRVVLMRGTIHLVSARDALTLRTLVQPYLSKTVFNGSEYGKRIQGVDPEALVEAGRRLLADKPLHVDELGAGLAEQFDGYAGGDLAYGLRGLMPLIQTPPRGVWGQGGGLTYASTGQWLGADPDTDWDAALDAAIPRYLAAYGPATIQDFQTWSSLTRTAPAFARLRDRLIVHRDAAGRELYDLPDIELPDLDGPLKPLLLGGFDNILLSHREREFVISKPAQKKVFRQNAMMKGTILIDGLVVGTWFTTLKKKTALLTFEPFESLSAKNRRYLEGEGERLLDFAAGTAETRTVEFT
ncbi:winged helix DNA-binding domain-containing protein [Stackebrandtia nassauensis]|uniref:Winged helix DNA-binding domain-containing protein n=1 Tax=Stackebrandtia nassauensis (strain DSM 44728 / CIP 108903 / NRRL B-16338 / NBRC 102104 / LLR-40K-21) TaxID=446470 RepID=D3PVX2_STANL|nr:winged helix DNA-binding domain-containing protein [Stackebrandtia nassauensis]ADD45093.1 conserved hypothetical protein [Stackebrandtia nassauensis DSM 44728]